MDRQLQIATVALLVILILGVTYIALQINPVIRLANSRLATALGNI